MALFGKKKTEETKKAPVAEKKVEKKPAKKALVPAAVPATTGTSAGNTDASGSILRPHITEKSGLLSQGGIYTFEISKNATKQTVSQAIRALYKVTPVKIGIVNLPARNVFVRGRRGVISGTRKAVVTVKKGEKIDFV